MEEARARLRLTVQASGIGSVVGAELVVDGRKVPVHSGGTQDVAIAPGRRRLQMSAWWLRRYGRAEIVVDVGPGEVVHVYYAPPHHMWGTGAIGERPQRRNGRLVQVAAIAAFFLFVGLVYVLLPG